VSLLPTGTTAWLCCVPLVQLREAEPLRHVVLSRLLAEKLAEAAALHGPDLAAAMAALDPSVGQQVQAVLAAAAARQHQQQQQCT